MTDFIDNLLTSMSSKFNETNTDLQINLNEDKTLKWRGLHNNQYAAVKKRKDIKRSEKSAQPNTSSTTTTTTDDPPLMSDSVSNTVNADDVATADVTKSHENDSIAQTSTVTSEKSDTNNSLSNDTKSVSADKMEKQNNDKNEKDDDQRPFRRTLRRKQNADETNDDASVVNAADKNRKVGLRPKRQSSAGSANENRSVSPRGEKDEKLSNEMATAAATAAANRNIMTRQRGRAKKHDRESSVEVQSKNTADESNDSLPKTRSERKNSISNEVDDGLSTQPPPLKLRRSERMHTSTPSDLKESFSTAQDDRIKTDGDGVDSKSTDKEQHATRSRKRTVDDKKSSECTEINDEKTVDDKLMANEMDVVVLTDDMEPVEKTEPKSENTQKMDDVEIIETTPDAHNEDQLSNGSDGTAVVRKRGRRPGITKGKSNLKINMTIATRNSPVKKSPRLTNDETPFVYTIPKKDKVAAEQVSLVAHSYFQMTL